MQRLKAHKYFEYAVDPQGKLQWSRGNHLIQAEALRDGLYLLITNARGALTESTLNRQLQPREQEPRLR